MVWRQTHTAVPAARSQGLLIEPVGDETVVYDTDSHQTHCLKPLAAVVFDCSDGDATVAEISAIAAERLGRTVTESEVADAVAQLAGLSLLGTGDVLVVSGSNGVSRREMIHRIAFSGAAVTVGSSLITTVAPSTARAASGLPTGCSGCSTGADCMSGLCCATLLGCFGSGQLGCCVGNFTSCVRLNCTCTLSGAPCPNFQCRPGAGICTCTTCGDAVALNTGCGRCPCSACPEGSSSRSCCQTT